MNGRTYCGHYKGFYLKSTLEYIYARYLDHMKISWDYEVKIYSLSNGGSFKPDFQLSSDHFVEIKGEFNYELDLPRVRLFEQDYNVHVEILRERDLRKMIRKTPFVFEHLKREWKSQSSGLGMDTSGANNPRYGVPMSQKTKDKIGKKASERFNDPVYKAKWKKVRMNSPKVQAQTERLKQYNIARAKVVFCECEICGKQFEVLFRKNKPRRFCSHACAASKQGWASKIQEAALDFALKNKEQIMTCKMNKIKPVLSPFYKQVEQISGVSDERTISKLLLGDCTNRKDMIRYFQSLITENVLRTTEK